MAIYNPAWLNLVLEQNTLKPKSMKPKKNELNVDHIGGLGPLTVQEESALSTYFKSRKKVTKSGKTTLKKAIELEKSNLK